MSDKTIKTLAPFSIYCKNCKKATSFTRVRKTYYATQEIRKYLECTECKKVTGEIRTEKIK